MGSVIEIGADSASVAPQTLKGRMREIVSVVYRPSNRLLLVLDIDHLLSEIAGAKNTAVDGGAA